MVLIKPRVYNLGVRKLALGGLALGCSWFELRSPEPGGGQGHWEPPTTPQAVLQNLEDALTYVIADNYTACLDPGFRFVPDPSLQGQVYENWYYQAEDSVIRAMFSQLDYTYQFPVDLSWSITDEQQGADWFVCEAQYEITVYVSWGEALYSRGRWKLTLRQDQDTKLWSVVQWEDFKEDTTSWAEVKALFR